MATPPFKIVEYFDTSFSSESPQDPSCCPVSHSRTPFLLLSDLATKGPVPSTTGSLEDVILCVDLHSFCLLNAPVFWFLNILRITATFTIHLIPAHLSGFISHKFSPQMSTTLKFSYSMTGFVHLFLLLYQKLLERRDSDSLIIVVPKASSGPSMQWTLNTCLFLNIEHANRWDHRVCNPVNYSMVQT